MSAPQAQATQEASIMTLQSPPTGHCWPWECTGSFCCPCWQPQDPCRHGAGASSQFFMQIHSDDMPRLVEIRAQRCLPGNNLQPHRHSARHPGEQLPGYRGPRPQKLRPQGWCPKPCCKPPQLHHTAAAGMPCCLPAEWHLFMAAYHMRPTMSLA